MNSWSSCHKYIPPACLPPPHNLGSPSTRWEGPCGEEYAPSDHWVRQGLITRDGQNKMIKLNPKQFCFCIRLFLHYRGPTCGSDTRTSWSLRLLRPLLSPADPLGIRACLEKVSFSPSSWQDDRETSCLVVNYTSQLHLVVCFWLETLTQNILTDLWVKHLRFIQVEWFY